MNGSFTEVIVIGAGQAGLSMSYLLKKNKIPHLVLEKNKVADSWENHRWDSFCLVTPNWQCKLPGYHYPGKDPYGFMIKGEIVEYLRNYAKSFDPPLIQGVEVLSVTKDELSGQFEIVTNKGVYHAAKVVVAIGNYHFASYPSISKQVSPAIYQVHSDEYKNPAMLPEGEVLVVGTGQSGCQIAEDIHLTGKKVHLCVGNAPRTARIYRGKDVVEWLDEMGYYDLAVADHPDGESVRSKTNHYVTGRDGGREIDLRKFALQGMKLYGSLQDINGDELRFKDNLKANLDSADATSENIKKKIDQYITNSNIDAVVEAPYQPAWEPSGYTPSINIAEANISSIVWCIGYGYNFRMIRSDVFDEYGLPIHRRGVTEEKDLYFLGLTWQNTWGSARFSGVGKDAEYLFEKMFGDETSGETHADNVNHATTTNLLNIV